MPITRFGLSLGDYGFMRVRYWGWLLLLAIVAGGAVALGVAAYERHANRETVFCGTRDVGPCGTKPGPVPVTPTLPAGLGSFLLVLVGGWMFEPSESKPTQEGEPASGLPL